MSIVKVLTEKEVDALALDFVKEMSNRKAGTKACVIFLKGDLGAGKTTFTKGVAQALNIEEEITSPTFVILKRYPITGMGGDFPYVNLIHIDAYRLKSYKELEQIKFSEYLEDSKNLILLEWPEMVESDELNPDKTFIFRHSDEADKRTVEIV